ncbi:MAG: hypothetical protein COU33_01975 [Candidatus Magasanikbacteria bacterium CG10_big_fil_rev_8_21_14_0_10_43_6]|uniref:Aminotransferase DegT n=1 Tax=Candidatus Magasanikbacteria bacterium CG10_big_fil_rev_8_21_14_0_10_43_6 TaxID=1974650 RepID=A0A2M6W1P6_9BACT|nr:MAG: hypothetical protein COU33_01975 [Candidatus Magasanikbacteria bacterium CG10_big_fil_rev_8_21_14_0_10_43_6]
MIPVAKPYIEEKEKEYVAQAVASGWVSSSGAFVDQFETQLAEYLGTAHVTSTSNGTAALHLALLGLGIGPGDEVIVPATSFIATLNAIFYVGATPVFVDVELKTWGIDSAKIEKKITEKTKAIIVVHLYGYSCMIHEVQAITDKHDLFLIEDNAESLGASADGKKLGTIGTVGTYSFFGNKIITTGEGGAVSTDDTALMERITMYKNHGRKTNRNYDHQVLGYNYRMTNMQAALGVAQLEQIDMFLSERKKIENIYREQLADNIIPQEDMPYAAHVNWFFSFRFKGSVDVPMVKKLLYEAGIDTRHIFSAMNTMPYLESFYQEQAFSHANLLHAEGMSLPTYVGLTEEETTYICKTLRGAIT